MGITHPSIEDKPVQYGHMKRIEEILEGHDTGLFVVHGNTGSGKTSLMRAISLRVSFRRGLKETDVASTSRSCRIPTREWVAGLGDPRLVIFGEIFGRQRAERAVALARKALVIAEMHDDRPERVIGQLVDDGIREVDARRVVIGHASLARYYEEENYKEIFKGWSPWFAKSAGENVGILVGELSP